MISVDGQGRQEPREIPVEEVRRRVRWARRRGQPAWLWPEVAISDWDAALARVEEATAAVLTGATGVELDGDPDAVGLAGYTSGMGPLLGLWLEQGRLSVNPRIAELLMRHLVHNRIRSSRMTEAAREVVGRLAAANIKTVMLKGAHTGTAVFPEPGARPASDIDLLIDVRDVAAAEASLRAAGLELIGRGRWESSWAPAAVRREPRTLTYVHADDAWSVDLHESLNIAAGGAAPVAELDRARPMASRGRWAPDSRAGVLDQPLLLLHLAAHAGAGWQSLTLLRQVELVMAIRRDQDAGRLSWDAFLDLGRRTRSLGYAWPVLHLCEVLAPGTVPEQVLHDCLATTPAGVRRALAGLTPATAQRIDRSSLSEHFMWAAGWRGKLRQLVSDIAPAVRSLPELFGIYEGRAWRLIRGRLSQ